GRGDERRGIARTGSRGPGAATAATSLHPGAGSGRSLSCVCGLELTSLPSIGRRAASSREPLPPSSMTQPLPPAPSPTAAVPVDMISPVRWVERGWDDLRANPIPGLAHGALITAFGWLLMWAAREKFWLLAGAFSGFLIVAPVLATGLYHV